jgi:hypothetical protein
LIQNGEIKSAVLERGFKFPCRQSVKSDSNDATTGYGDVWTWTATDADTKLIPFGMAHSAVVLRNVGDCWKVLLFLPSDPLPELEALLRSFDRLGLEEGQPEAVPKVTLLAPTDHAQLVRFPRPDLEWAPVDPHLAAYTIESQYGQPGREYWSASAIKVVSPVPGEAPLRTQMPFGVGRQPHRWRIWAIGRSGTVSTSDWREIDFTN